MSARRIVPPLGEVAGWRSDSGNTSQAKDQLIRLKTRTGIAQWNMLCRWTFCLSLRQPTSPTPVEIPADSNVELSWPVFAGEYHEIALALLKERCLQDGQPLTDDALARQFPPGCLDQQVQLLEIVMVPGDEH